jgi:TonB-dependent receptor-like protein/carboxypeptidase family protein
MKSQLRAITFVLLLLASVSYAQSNTGIIHGVITDKNGSVAAGATVRLTNAITNYSQTAVADSQGAYRMIDVPFNNYLLSVETAGAETVAREVSVRTNLAQQIDVQLGVAPVRQQLDVTATRELIEAEKTAPTTVIDLNRIARFPTSQPSRSAEELVGTAPGWTVDANGRLHARGIEYQVQYSIDGIPITDTIADTFSAAPDPRNFRSVEVSTANIPAEFGNKLAGIIDVTTRTGLEIPNSGSVTLSGGSFATFESSFDIGGHTRKFGYFISAAGSTTDRFLDPPAIENFHNNGRAIKSFLKFDYAPSEKNLFRLNLFGNYQKFDVPNLEEQEDEGQNQRRRLHDNMQSFSWEHIFSPNLLSYLAGYHRYNAANLRSNEETGPVFAEQSRHHSNYGLLGSLTWHKSRHTIKTGFEFVRFPVTESFTLSFTDLGEVLEKEPDLPEDVQEFVFPNAFFFNDHRTGWEASAYVQDHINATRNLTFDLGARFDSYNFLVEKNYVSPRLGMAYRIAKSRTVLRAAYNRFLQTPALENLLLSSSEEARIFSPGGEEEGGALARRRALSGRFRPAGFRRAAEEDEGEGEDENRGAPVRPSREWQVDAGFQQQLAKYLRLDADFYYRRLKNPPEITNFLETGIIFPATLDHSRSKGIETRLDLARVHGLSGFVSYTNLHIYGFAPITGGLFLGEAVDLRERAGQRVNIEEDQRNTLVFQAMYDNLPGKFWMAFGGRHDSGFSVELEEDANEEEFMKEFPKKVLDRVNFERGFIKPHTVLDFSIGRDFALNEHVSLSGQFNVQNLADRFYLITFESVFSGTTIGRPRNYSGKLSINFK